MSSENGLTGVLTGIRVLDVTAYAQGALASALLADLGADVIKVEPPDGGDPSRSIKRVWETPQVIEVDGREHGLAFEFFNRNKRGIGLNLKTPDGRMLLGRLIQESDILIHNYRRKTMESLGLGYDDVRAHNPEIVYVWSSASGKSESEEDLGGFDITGLARSGLLDPTGELGQRPGSEPIYAVGAIGDVMGATMTAFAALGGLFHRRETGVGQEIHASQLGALTWLQYNTITTYLATGAKPRRTPRGEQQNPLFNWYRCGDDRWMCLGMFRTERYWKGFCSAVGRPDFAESPEYLTAELRAVNRRELIAILDEIFASANRATWMRRLREAGAIVAPIETIEQSSVDQALRENGYLRQLDHDIVGQLTYAVFPAEFSKSPVSLRRRAPLLGEDGDAVLLSLAGCTESELDEFRRGGVIPLHTGDDPE